MAYLGARVCWSPYPPPPPPPSPLPFLSDSAVEEGEEEREAKTSEVWTVSAHRSGPPWRRDSSACPSCRRRVAVVTHCVAVVTHCVAVS